MKKLKNFIRFCFISLITLVIFIFCFRAIIKLIWHFDILDEYYYQFMMKFWERGGVFNSVWDYSLGFVMILVPIVWIICSYKIYKYGLKKLMVLMIVKIYRKATKPKNMEIEHVTIKNLGGKGKTLDEIISEKVKDKAGYSEKTVNSLRRQISSKIEENENQ